MASEAQFNANRENAKKSHGPTSEAGVEACRAAATTHGLHTRVAKLITDSQETYDHFTGNTFSRLHPVTDPEKDLVLNIANLEFKLVRASVYEECLIAKGIYDNRNNFPPEECPPEIRDVIVLGAVIQTNAKTLNTLSTESARVQRCIEKNIAQYEKVRRDRELIEEAARNIAMDSILGKSNEPSLKHPTVGTLYPYPFILARLEFCNGAGRENVYAFDRIWADPKVKPAAIPWVWTRLRPEQAA